MSDPNDYNYAGINERHVPSNMPAGRVLESIGSTGSSLRESQIALLDPDDAGTTQVAALQKLARETEGFPLRQPRELRPLHVDELPVRVTYPEALALVTDFKAPSPLWALVGAGGDELSPVGVDLLAEGPGFTIAGPPRSGRSTVLATMVQSLLDPNIGEGTVPVVLICPRPSPLRGLGSQPGVLTMLDADADEIALENAIDEMERYVIVVDDAELLDSTPLDIALSKQLRDARDKEAGIVIAGTTQDLSRGYHGFIPDARRSRSGVLLDLRSADDGDILGLRLPRDTGRATSTGRGLLVSLSRPLPVQVALPGWPLSSPAVP
jgi:S-DNA-T family DNA segregation ATPase FtsK/SpoIIIE